MKMEDVPALGTQHDMDTRRNDRRVDSADRQIAVNKARDLIYNKGLNVNSKRVDDLLKPESLTPTEVRTNHHFKVLSR